MGGGVCGGAVMWRAQTTVIPGSPEETAQINAQVREEQKSDREFWSDCVRNAINGDDTSDHTVRRAIAVADGLLAARRERFPL